MRLERGSIVTVATGSGFGSKPRPALVMQADPFLDRGTIVLLIFTTELGTSPSIRPIFHPDDQNGLREPSALMADLPVTARREKIGQIVGQLSPADLTRAERALLLVLGFA